MTDNEMNSMVVFRLVFIKK